MMKVEVALILRGLYRVEVPDTLVGKVRSLDFPVELRRFEEAAGVKINWTDVSSPALCEVHSFSLVSPGVLAGDSKPVGSSTSRADSYGWGGGVSRGLTVESIILGVSDHYGVKLNDLKSAKRRREISFPRMVAMYLARKLTGASFPKIGRCFGGKDHTTVIAAVRKVAHLAIEDSDLRGVLAALEEFLCKSVTLAGQVGREST